MRSGIIWDYDVPAVPAVLLRLEGEEGKSVSHQGKEGGQPGELPGAFSLGQGGGEGCGGGE